MASKSIPTFEGVFDQFLDDDSFFSDQRKTITFTIETGGTADPITGELTSGTTTTFSAQGFRRDVSDREFSDVKGGDLVFTCKQEDLGYTPAVNDTPVIDSTTYKVIDVQDRGQVAWAIQLRV